MAEHVREQNDQPLAASVSPTNNGLQLRIEALENRLNEMSKTVELLSAWRKFELQERSGSPEMHAGRRVIGRIPIWGSGRYILVLKTPKDSFELDIV